MKRELIYAAVIGGVVGAVLVMAAGSLAPLGAQNEVADAEFGTITCSKLVVRYDGSSYATEINPLYVKVSVDGEESAKLGSYGMSVVGKEGKGKAYVMVNNGGGVVSVYGNGREGVRMAINEDGGAVRVFGKDGGGSAGMAIDEDGGAVRVFGKGDQPARAAIEINEYGNGAVSTWDKNGYRLATLK